jgi:DNA-directed RNA polymerase subunit omega
MARITVEDCLKKVDNQYDLVLLAKERTVQLNAGSPMLVEEDNDKRTIISLREIGDGKIEIKDIQSSAIKRLRKEPDELEQQEETEEETNDDFEDLYKGQVSKSGVAILPSKRTRRIPEVKKPSLAEEALSELKADQPEIKEENLETEEAPLELSEEAPTQEAPAQETPAQETPAQEEPKSE